MKEFRGKVAVITGAASGIGRGIAERCAQEGMKVVLADVEESALAKTEKVLRAKGAQVLSVLTDVSKVGDVETLAKKTLDTFGEVQFYILTHLAETTPLVRQRMEDILQHRNPLQVDIDDFLFLRR